MKTFIALGLAVVGGCLGGCKGASPEQQLTIAMTVLKEAQFNGQFNFSSDGKIGGEVTNGFWVGGHAAAIHASGTVNFNVKDKPVEGPPAPDGD